MQIFLYENKKHLSEFILEIFIEHLLNVSHSENSSQQITISGLMALMS